MKMKAEINKSRDEIDLKQFTHKNKN